MPRVSVIMACKNVGSFIDAAIGSARGQSIKAIEIIVVDDGSEDGTAALAQVHADEDSRVRILNGSGTGPAAARNRAIGAARGDWLAVLDGDDIMHPRRLELLLRRAEGWGADIIADNLLGFYDDEGEGAHPYLLVDAPNWRRVKCICLDEYILSNVMFSKAPCLGYLKPLVKRELLLGERYDEALRIGEDYDLIARLLAKGAKFIYLPAPLYFYRRHGSSISHRLRTGDLEALILAAERFHGALPDASSLAASALRLRALGISRHFSCLVDALKDGQAMAAMTLFLQSWRADRLLFKAAWEALGKRLRRLLSLGRSRRRGAGKALILLGPDQVLPPLLRQELVADGLQLVELHFDFLKVEDGFGKMSDEEMTDLSMRMASAGPAETIVVGSPYPNDWAALAISPQARVLGLNDLGLL